MVSTQDSQPGFGPLEQGRHPRKLGNRVVGRGHTSETDPGRTHRLSPHPSPRSAFTMHMEAGHSAVPEEGPKDLRCPLCLYHTKYKRNMIDHIVLHRGNLPDAALLACRGRVARGGLTGLRSQGVSGTLALVPCSSPYLQARNHSDNRSDSQQDKNTFLPRGFPPPGGRQR